MAVRNSLFALAIAVGVAAPAFAQAPCAATANTICMSQVGDGNRIVVQIADTGADRTTGVLNQLGDGNNALVMARGNNNSYDITQRGNGNAATQVLNGSNNSASLSQGDTAFNGGNTAVQVAMGANNSSTLVQAGSNNVARLVQAPTAEAILLGLGTARGTSILQAAFASGATGSNDNSIALEQNGSDNVANLTQRGSGHSITLTQNGGASIRIAQAGSAKTITVDQPVGQTGLQIVQY